MLKEKNGTGIESITKTKTEGLIDTYTITFTDGTTTIFEIINGKDGIDGINGTNGKSIQFNWNGTQLGIKIEGQSEYTYVDLKGQKGDKGEKGEPGDVSTAQLQQAQQELVDDMSKTYTGNNITAPTVAGYGRINKLYGKTTEVGTGEKSPDNPYTLKCVGDDVNLFDMNNSNKLSAYTEGSSNMIKSASHMKLIYIACEPNTTYTSQKIVSTNNNLSYTTEVPAVGVNFYGRVLNDSSSTCTITTGSNAKYLVLVYYDSSKDTVSEQKILNSIKIQKGSVAKPYSPYGYGTVETISKNGDQQSSNIVVARPLCSIGDIRDELDYTNKKITRRCGHKIFNGSEDWWTGTSHTNCIGFETMLTGNYQIPQTCSHFKYVNNYNLDEPHMYIFNNTMYVFIPKTIASTLSEFKTWLASNPITVIYGLSTPTTESIDCLDKIVQYDGTTNVYNRDGAEIEVDLTNNDAISGINENLDNIEKSYLKDKIEDVDLITIINGTIAAIFQKKYGKLAFISINLKLTLTANSYTKIAQLKKKPVQAFYQIVSFLNNQYASEYTVKTEEMLFIDTDGSIYIRSLKAHTDEFARFSLMYLTD